MPTTNGTRRTCDFSTRSASASGEARATSIPVHDDSRGRKAQVWRASKGARDAERPIRSASQIAISSGTWSGGGSRQAGPSSQAMMHRRAICSNAMPGCLFDPARSARHPWARCCPSNSRVSGVAIGKFHSTTTPRHSSRESSTSVVHIQIAWVCAVCGHDGPWESRTSDEAFVVCANSMIGTRVDQRQRAARCRM